MRGRRARTRKRPKDRGPMRGVRRVGSSIHASAWIARYIGARPPSGRRRSARRAAREGRAAADAVTRRASRRSTASRNRPLRRRLGRRDLALRRQELAQLPSPTNRCWLRCAARGDGIVYASRPRRPAAERAQPAAGKMTRPRRHERRTSGASPGSRAGYTSRRCTGCSCWTTKRLAAVNTSR